MTPATLRTIDRLELAGGSLALDLANTVSSRHGGGHDYLGSYDDLVAWSEKVGTVSRRQADRLRQLACDDTRAATAALEAAIALRELVHRVFSAIAADDTPPRADLDALADAYARATTHARIEVTPGGYALLWPLDRAADGPLWPLAHAAGRLLFDDDLDRVKQCPGCGWLFVDASRNRSRRWCSMDTCGSRDKMRRYHQRSRARDQAQRARTGR